MPSSCTISSDALDDSASDENDAMVDVSSKSLATFLQAPNGKIFNNTTHHCCAAHSKLIACVSMLIAMQTLVTIMTMEKMMIKSMLITIDSRYKVVCQNVKDSYHHYHHRHLMITLLISFHHVINH